MRFRQVVLGAVAALSMVSGAMAQPDYTVATLLRDAKKGSEAETLVIGAASGLEAGNYRLMALGRPALFCPPKGLTITGDQWMRILRDFVKENSKAGEQEGKFFAIVMAEAIARVFPCAD